MTKTKTLYFGAGWFNEKQNKAYKEAMEALKKNPTVDLENSYVPLDNQYKGMRVDEHPQYLNAIEWVSAYYHNALVGNKSSDVMVGVYFLDEEDVG